ncbi:isochorismatase [Bacillus salitolerans]|uniref:Isochorismatase n=1 Tax=Bacillus salitolerans TaxID=1437434 RepID=A0ABW4LWX1_9BACI
MIELREEYKKRSIRFIDVWETQGWSMKLYGISYENEYPKNNLIQDAKELAVKILPLPAKTDARYGVGFIGIHEGAGANFIFIDWWSDENELNHHVYVASHDTPDHYEYATPKGLIACCWDLKVLSFERDSWVKTVLANPAGVPNIDEYMKLQLNEDV